MKNQIQKRKKIKIKRRNWNKTTHKKPERKPTLNEEQKNCGRKTKNKKDERKIRTRNDSDPADKSPKLGRPTSPTRRRRRLRVANKIGPPIGCPLRPKDTLCTATRLFWANTLQPRRTHGTTNCRGRLIVENHCSNTVYCSGPRCCSELFLFFYFTHFWKMNNF